ncbi:MAGNESIUM TRANSPORTER MRS2-F [Salix koriyanagi]|uniref:Magnesium transporter n=1 Tax=Salix koriyanagi TaxID=2511006 RepID=A0A9Q0UPF6_9ROSI|nr:MAGNESIUM TRANSPORTER MRS2-F [Salix koriyanagi]
MNNNHSSSSSMATKLKKGMSVVKAWLAISESGQSSIEEIGKHSIMKRTGLPARDLRALDPLLSYPSSILGRERAIVVSLEHIRAIITAKEVFLINYNNPLVVQFVQDLQHRIVFGNNNITSPNQAMDHSGREMEDAAEEIEGEGSTINVSVAAGPKALPFEFKALEACLESACRCLESETRTLEEEAYPALDELTSKISTLNLERVRQIKSRLVALSGRVQKVRDELENLLDDDNDMAEMYLTEKVADAHAVDQISIIEEVDDGESEADDESVYDPKAGDYSEINTNVDIEELEMLLEAYFAQIDGILQKLSGMSEYVDDTEDFINIMLDDKQNQLLQMGVILSATNMILNAGIAVVGFFGMNIHVALFDGKPIQFWETVIGTCGGCIALFLVLLGWGKKKKILAL